MKEHPEHIVFFDGVCNFCNASVQFIARRNPKRHIFFSHIESSFAENFLEDAPDSIRDSDSIIFYQYGQWFHKSEAALQIARHLQFPWNLLSIFRILPRSFRDYLYEIIAQNRYRWFGKKAACQLPLPGEKKRLIENFLSGQSL